MVGHNAGPAAGTLFLDTRTLADHVETQLDELGWGSAHIVGNSLGGWVAFELERRRARTITDIAPAGWVDALLRAKFEVVLKFVLGAPLWAVACLLGPRVAEPAVQPSGDHAGDQRDARWAQLCRPGCGDRRRGAPTGLHPVGQSPTVGGLEELAETRAPAHLVICEKDRVVPAPRFTRRFTGHLPPDTLVTTLDGSGTSRCSRRRTGSAS
jgi:pimeloyl-ACP methyl ester carboxylesterase